LEFNDVFQTVLRPTQTPKEEGRFRPCIVGRDTTGNAYAMDRVSTTKLSLQRRTAT
jgi:hypothetical protein